MSMQVLAETIKAAEPIGKPTLGTWLFLPEEPVRRLRLMFLVTASMPVEAKELLCNLHLYSAEGTRLTVEESTWPLSGRLAAPYHYFPAVSESETVKLKAFGSSTPFSAAVVHLVPWKRKLGEGEPTVRGCLALEELDIGGSKFMNHLELPKLELSRG